MEDKFDEILGDKIKDLVENNHVPYNPEHWDLLLAKRNKKKKRAFIYWRYAAVVLLGLFAGGMGKYFYDNGAINENSNEEIIFDSVNDSVRIDSLKKDFNVKITTIEEEIVPNKNLVVIKTDSTIAKKTKDKKLPKNKLILDEDVIKVVDSKPTKSDIIIDKNDKDLLKIATIDNVKSNSIDVQDSKVLNDTLFEKSELLTERIDQNIDSLKIVNEFIAQLDGEIEAIESNKKKIKLGVGLSPILDYYQDSESSKLGFSGGIIVEIPLSKRFNINAGVYYADQKLDLNNAAKYQAEGVSAKESRQIISKEAIITGIEIPLNIKYNFNIDNKNVFVSAGVLSTSYIKENVESEYLVNSRSESRIQDSFGNNIVQYNLVQLEEKSVIENDSNGFNLANALNFSFGIELPINKDYQSIIIEPYFKYSLQTVTQQKLDLNSAGIHIRYNFGFSLNK